MCIYFIIIIGYWPGRVTGQMIWEVGSWVNCCDPLPALVCVRNSHLYILCKTVYLLYL